MQHKDKTEKKKNKNWYFIKMQHINKTEKKKNKNWSDENSMWVKIVCGWTVGDIFYSTAR